MVAIKKSLSDDYHYKIGKGAKLEVSAGAVFGTNMSNTVARLRSDLNVSRQRAERLEAQLDTLRGMHVAAITGQPPREALERLFSQLANLEAQQTLKDRHLEE